MFIHRWYWSCIFFIISLWYHKFIFQLFTVNKIFFVTSLLWWILTDCHFLEIFHFQLYRLEIFYLTFIGKSMKKLFFLTSPIIWIVFNGLRVLAILCLLPETWKQVGDNCYVVLAKILYSHCTGASQIWEQRWCMKVEGIKPWRY